MGFEEIMGIRNVAILGHGGCGKTTLTEAIAYTSGAVNRQGRVEDGSTISDYDKEEITRHFSISSVVVPVKWKDTKIVTRGSEEKLSRLYVLRGKEQFEVKQLRAGDIGAIAKMGNTVTGDSLATKENPVLYKTPEFSKPYTYVRYQAKKKGGRMIRFLKQCRKSLKKIVLCI